jgi:sec-independent protein translocase protein TatA
VLLNAGYSFVASTFSRTFAQNIIVMEIHYALFNMGPMELFLAFMAIVLLFGGKKIPELMRGIGQGVREFNSAKSNLKQEIEEGMKKDNTAAPKAKETEETKA